MALVYFMVGQQRVCQLPLLTEMGIFFVLSDWRPALNLAALDCADESNSAVCRDFNIPGFPTVRVCDKEGKVELGMGSGLLCASLASALVAELSLLRPVSWPPLTPLRNLIEPGPILDPSAQWLCRLETLLSLQVTLDLSQHHGLAVRRVFNTENDVVSKFGVTDFPSCYLLFRNGSVSRVPVLVESRSFYTAYLQRLSGLTREVPPTTAVPVTADKIAPTVWKVADPSKIYMADLESALHYILRVEVGKFSVLEGQRLMALKKFVAVLAKYFPGQPLVQNFLHSINDWLKRQQRKKIPYSFFKTVLDSRKEDSVLAEKVNWVGCQGSEPHFRGFPCSLWVLFHLLTVQASQQNANRPQEPANGQEVLQAIRNYVRFFFGCRDCAGHFEQMAAASMHRVASPNDAVLWLWTGHNRVNARLAGAPSEDPQFPKVQWPPRELCTACHNELRGVPVWDLGATLNFLKVHFSPSNIVLKSPAAGPAPRRGTLSLAVTPKLVMGALELVTRNSTSGSEQADAAQSPGTTILNIPAERLEASSPQLLPLGPGVNGAQGPPEHVEELQTDVLEQPQGERHLNKRDTGAVLLAEAGAEVSHLRGPSELRQGGRSFKQLASIAEGEPEARAMRGQGQWLQVLGGGFSHLDISLCVGLYSLSFMGLLVMYTYFRARVRALKGLAGYPAA
uniref:Sulfhydryl oxidase n=1 Tax=Castor canadensis TaxID=51338 RepID=A0A8C0XFE4_CASCN